MSFRYCSILAAFVLGVFGVCASAEMSPEQVHSLFAQGNESFRKANAASDSGESQRLYEKAILSFESIVNESHIRNAKLHYNLANAYLLKGDVGKAILNYRRAEKLDASDANIQKNLAFAMSRRIDKVDIVTQKKVLQTLFFWHYDFSMRTRFLLACISFAMVCVGLIVTIWKGRRACASVIIVAGTVLLICMMASVVIEWKNDHGKIGGVIIAAEVVARQGDGPNYPASFEGPLHAGTEFEVLERRSGWVHILLSDNSEGWIAEDSAGLL